MSRCDTSSEPRRTARTAASLTMAASSAPTRPLVSRAVSPRSTSLAMATFCAWTRRICSRPTKSGGGTRTMRSKRPGRTSAGSSTLRRFVAARTTTPSLGTTPSMHASSWFNVCSTSSLAPFMAKFDSRRALPKASISSMKMTQDPSLAALAKSWRTLAAPRPTNISTNSEPEQEMKGTRAALASARARSVLPVPGGPTSMTPRGARAPTAA
mmetsp:Transcript_2500/g.8264  ORF Transcript_2500/g.8264 Transcript_2500/m.8264 type:complete len:212 (+) Transcript_2500:400-1035(+)